MGLAVGVGVLADTLENDSDGAQWFRESFESINEVLAENGLPPHQEPETLPPLDSRDTIGSFPYSWLHHLRRAAAYAAETPGWIATPFPESSDPATDPVVERRTFQLDSHLLCHSDCEGFYVPIRFEEVLFDDDRISGGMLGSSFVLLDELIAVAPALGIRLGGSELSDDEVERINGEVDDESPLWIEQAVWLSLFEAARLSVRHGTAICFG
ncbi:MAG: hypothetical protein WD066_19140 [Planctomycetaceae bacterium]